MESTVKGVPSYTASSQFVIMVLQSHASFQKETDNQVV